MTHIAIQESLDGKVVDWLEQVTDEQYGVYRPSSVPASEVRPKTGASAYPDGRSEHVPSESSN